MDQQDVAIQIEPSLGAVLGEGLGSQASRQGTFCAVKGSVNENTNSGGCIPSVGDEQSWRFADCLEEFSCRHTSELKQVLSKLVRIPEEKKRGNRSEQ